MKMPPRLPGIQPLPAPPTFGFILNALSRDKAVEGANVTEVLGINIGHVLHGEQGFEYFRPLYAGDTVTLTTRVIDIYEKKNGAMEFLVTSVEVVNQHGDLCTRLRNTIVVRNPEAQK
jgi:Uncharacterized conserved protein